MFRAVSRGLQAFHQAPEVIAVVGVAVSTAIVIAATNIHRPDSINVSARTISRLLVADAATATISVYAQTLLLGGATGQIDVVLPAATSGCQELAGQLHAICSGSAITMNRSLAASWPTPQQFALTVAADQIELTTLAQQDGGGLQFAVTNGPVPRLCMYQDPGPERLSLRMGSTDVTLPNVAGGMTTCSGLVVSVQSPDPHGTSGFILQKVTGTRALLSGKQMTVAAQSLRLTLNSTSTDANFDGGEIEISSDRQFTVTAEGIPPDIAARRDIEVANATDVQEAHATRLASAWTRYPAVSYVAAGAPTLLGLANLAYRSRVGPARAPKRRRGPAKKKP